MRRYPTHQAMIGSLLIIIHFIVIGCMGDEPEFKVGMPVEHVVDLLFMSMTSYRVHRDLGESHP